MIDKELVKQRIEDLELSIQSTVEQMKNLRKQLKKRKTTVKRC